MAQYINLSTYFSDVDNATLTYSVIENLDALTASITDSYLLLSFNSNQFGSGNVTVTVVGPYVSTTGFLTTVFHDLESLLAI